ncbi:hypothetical protein [Xanthobacter agilis]|uniref:hypothetical protein n=1 Tax=Xanthobacter agilis TaxID=47492 RepID=UPI00372AD90D
MGRDIVKGRDIAKVAAHRVAPKDCGPAPEWTDAQMAAPRAARRGSTSAAPRGGTGEVVRRSPAVTGVAGRGGSCAARAKGRGRSGAGRRPHIKEPHHG